MGTYSISISNIDKSYINVSFGYSYKILLERKKNVDKVLHVLSDFV
jgi:hypothetical protein